MPLRVIERWISTVRLFAVPFTISQVAMTRGVYPGDREAIAWAVTVVFGIGAVALFWLTRRPLPDSAWRPIGIAALVFDMAIVSAYVLVYSFEEGTPTPQALYLPLVGGCVRFGIAGGVAIALASVPVIAAFEYMRADQFDDQFHWDFLTLRVGLELLTALILGWLVQRLAQESSREASRADEAELLRDELGRRADLVEAASRCARALSSSLELDAAFGAFIRELRGLVPFDRVAIVLADDGMAQVMATAGIGAEAVPTPGPPTPLRGTLLELVITSGEPIVRPELDPDACPEEAALFALGLRSRLAAPLLAGTRAIGMLSLGRTEPDAFSPKEAEVVGLLGRLVAGAVENIRAYEAERRTVEELRRLSTLRADFVALVSHELRTPLTSVLGSTKTLRRRWRDLPPEQRDSLLAVAVTESERLATLVEEVLDTSRIDAGTFSYSFANVELAPLIEAAVAAAASDGVDIVTRLPGGIPIVRGDPARLRQVLGNLIDNAVKYSPADGTVEVRATAAHEQVVIDVTDDGSGISPDDFELIFEKFGRVDGAGATPGTGLGLYIARAIAEAHGGSLDVASAPGRGSTFTLTLPAA